MSLNDWINNLFPLPKTIDWQEILQDSSSPFSYAPSEQLANLLEKSVAIKGIAGHLPQFLPVLLTCGTPEIALTQLLNFSDSFRDQNGSDFNWSLPETKALLHVFGRSNFLANRLKRNPQLAERVLESPFLLKKKSVEIMETELRKRLEQQPEFSLKEFKNI